MKKIAVLVLCLCLFAFFGPQGMNCKVSANEYAPEVISIALYNGSGACRSCMMAMKNMFEWMNCNVTIIDEGIIIDGQLEGYDVLAVPGGEVVYDVGQQGKANIQNFIRDGGGYLGICAGAYWAADYELWKANPDFPPPAYMVLGNESNLDLFPGVARGPLEQINLFFTYAMPKINIVNHNHPITSGLPDQMQILYAGGCELLPYEGANVTILGTYDATGTPAIVAFEYGSGRVFITGPHPEFEEDSDRDGFPPDLGLSDPDSEWPLLLNAVDWLAHRPIPAAAISCNSSSSAITAGDTITITGSISPAHPGEVVTLLYTRPSINTLTNPIKTNRTYLELFSPTGHYHLDTPPSISIPNPDGITWSVYAPTSISTVMRSATTDSSGAYADLCAPVINGTWTVYASWSPDGYHISASPTVTFEVKLNATLTIQSSASSVIAGLTITISGLLSPAQYGNVTILRSVNGSAFASIGITVLTNGTYSFQTLLNDAGTYQFKASWSGNENYNAATSGTITVVASTAAPIDPLWYVVIAGVVIVAITAAVYFLRRR